MKDRYINNAIEKLQGKAKKVTNKRDIIDTINLLGMIVGGVCLIGGLTGAAPLALAGATVLATCSYNKAKNILLAKETLNRFENEEKHLSQIKYNIPKSSTALTKKRVNKIKALRNRKNKLDESYKAASVFSKATLIPIGVGVAWTFINPYFSVLSLGSLGIHAICGTRMMSLHKERENTENRCNNIINDLEVIVNNERDQQAERIGNRKVMKPEEGKEKQKTKENKNEQAVNEYVDNLANQKQGNKSNQKVKK